MTSPLQYLNKNLTQEFQFQSKEFQLRVVESNLKSENLEISENPIIYIKLESTISARKIY